MTVKGKNENARKRKGYEKGEEWKEIRNLLVIGGNAKNDKRFQNTRLKLNE